MRSWTARGSRGNKDKLKHWPPALLTPSHLLLPQKRHTVYFATLSNRVKSARKEIKSWFDATAYHNFAADCEEVSTTASATTTELISCEGPVPCRYDDKTGEIGMFADTRQGEIRDGNTRSWRYFILTFVGYSWIKANIWSDWYCVWNAVKATFQNPIKWSKVDLHNNHLACTGYWYHLILIVTDSSGHIFSIIPHISCQLSQAFLWCIWRWISGRFPMH